VPVSYLFFSFIAYLLDQVFLWLLQSLIIRPNNLEQLEKLEKLDKYLVQFSGSREARGLLGVIVEAT